MTKKVVAVLVAVILSVTCLGVLSYAGGKAALDDVAAEFTGNDYELKVKLNSDDVDSIEIEALVDEDQLDPEKYEFFDITDEGVTVEDGYAYISSDLVEAFLREIKEDDEQVKFTRISLVVREYEGDKCVGEIEEPLTLEDSGKHKIGEIDADFTDNGLEFEVELYDTDFFDKDDVEYIVLEALIDNNDEDVTYKEILIEKADFDTVEKDGKTYVVIDSADVEALVKSAKLDGEEVRASRVSIVAKEYDADNNLVTEANSVDVPKGKDKLNEIDADFTTDTGYEFEVEVFDDDVEYIVICALVDGDDCKCDYLEIPRSEFNINSDGNAVISADVMKEFIKSVKTLDDESVAYKDITVYAEEWDADNNFVAESEPVAVPAVVKLMPKEGSTTMIERDHFVETYNDLSTEKAFGVQELIKATADVYDPFDEYNPYTKNYDYDDVDEKLVEGEGETVDYTDWYIYGLAENLYVEDLDSYIEVIGGGSYKVYAIDGDITNDDDVLGADDDAATGVQIVVYDASGEFVEKFTIVIFGDINGNAQANNADRVAAYSEVQKKTTWHKEDSAQYRAYKVKAADINQNGEFNNADQVLLYSLVSKKVTINQITGRTEAKTKQQKSNIDQFNTPAPIIRGRGNPRKFRQKTCKTYSQNPRKQKAKFKRHKIKQIQTRI